MDNNLQIIHIIMTQEQIAAAKPLIIALLKNFSYTYRWTADTNRFEIQPPRQNSTTIAEDTGNQIPMRYLSLQLSHSTLIV